MTSFFTSPASKPSLIDGTDSLSFDILDPPEPFPLANTPFDLAAKLLCQQTYAYQAQMDPHKHNPPGSYNHGPPHNHDNSPENGFVAPDPLHRQLHAQLLRQNALDMLGLCAPPMESFDHPVPEVGNVPEFFNSSMDCSFIELSLAESQMDYDHFLVMENELFRQQLLQQPVPHKPASLHHPPAHSTPSSSTLSILTPVSSVAEDTWAQFPGFPSNSSNNGAAIGQFATASTLRQPEIHSSTAHFGPAARKSFKNSVRPFARTPELPMRRINYHYLHVATTNKAETALGWASLPQNRRSTASRTSLASTNPSSSRSGLMLLEPHEERFHVSPRQPATQKSIIEESHEHNEPQPAPPKKKHKRRHTQKRSRMGCWICRIKHLKCDETRPVCNHCKRFGVACDYSPDRPDYVSDMSLRRKKLNELASQRRRKRR